MFSGQARWFLLAGLSGSALLACSSDATPDSGSTAGASSGGSAGSPTAGATSTAGKTGTAGTASGGTSSGTAGASSTAGTGGTAAGSGSGGTAGSAAGGGSGGASAGAGGGGGAGGGAAMPTAVFDIKGLGANAATVAGTATFTQGATMTKMVLNLTACPNGAHASHLHLMKDCGNNGDAAGGHWVPNGEGLGDYTCAANKVTYEFSKPTSMWTVGGDKATDVTQYSFMVHEMGGAAPGGKIGCGIATIK